VKDSPENASSLAVGGRSVSERRFGLKRATDEAHARLEEIVQSGEMLATVEGYRRYLAATRAMRDRFERLLEINGAAGIWPEWPSRRIAELPAHDMADLHLARPCK
jgi:heme oxygenase